MNTSISPIKRITSTTKTGNHTLPTTSTIETADFGHYRFLKCRSHFIKIQKNYDIRVFSRHIIDEKLNFFKIIFLWKKECFHSAGYRAQDLSIAGQMLYYLSYGVSTKLFSQNLFTPIWPRIYHELFAHFSKSFQSIMSIIRRVYHSPW